MFVCLFSFDCMCPYNVATLYKVSFVSHPVSVSFLCVLSQLLQDLRSPLGRLASPLLSLALSLFGPRFSRLKLVRFSTSLFLASSLARHLHRRPPVALPLSFAKCFHPSRPAYLLSALCSPRRLYSHALDRSTLLPLSSRLTHLLARSSISRAWWLLVLPLPLPPYLINPALCHTKLTHTLSSTFTVINRQLGKVNLEHRTRMRRECQSYITQEQE